MNRTSAFSVLGGVLVAALATVAVRGDGPSPTKPSDRKTRDEDIRKLETQIEMLEAEIEAREKQLVLLTKDKGHAARVAAVAARYADLEKVITQLDFEAIKLQVEVEVLKKVLAEKGEKAPDAQAVQEVLDRDPDVIRLKQTVQKAKELLKKVSESGGNPNAPVVREARDELARAETALKAREAELRKAATEIALDRATATIRARIEEAELGLRINTKACEGYKAERNEFKKLLATSETGALDVEKMKAALVPQRELLATLQTTLIRLRLEAKGFPPPVPVPATNDDKLDRILRELAELRKDVQELKKK